MWPFQGSAASTQRPLLPSGSSHTVFLQGNNDDLILSCCLHYCKDKAKDFMPTSKGTALPLPQGHPPSALLILPVLRPRTLPGEPEESSQGPVHLWVRPPCHSFPTRGDVGQP